MSKLDKLFKDEIFVYWGISTSKSTTQDWVRRVKVEVDKLQSYNKTLDEAYTEACEEIVDLQMKLKAVTHQCEIANNILNEWKEQSGRHYQKLEAIQGIIKSTEGDNALRNSYAWDVVKEIMEVLGDSL